ncbi:MAG TPA: hypothetical protein VNB64_05705 [Solirubrobacteraceae bacterium]|nr:hypothetical protein [Solirubrobacteraceae bacterium]
MRIRQAARVSDDGYRSELVAGLRVAGDAERLAAEIGFSAARLAEVAAAPPGLYAEVASEPDLEAATWLAFLIAYLSPTEDEDPFAEIRAARESPGLGGIAAGEAGPAADVSGEAGPTANVSGAAGPAADAAGEARPRALFAGGPRTAHDPARGTETVVAYRRWAERAGSQAAALSGEPHWDGERRFARAFERLALPGFHRTARFDLLTALGRTGRYDLRAGSLRLSGATANDDTAVAAKRVFGIADPLLIDRRAAALAQAAGVPLEALDLALFNWQRGEERRATLGAGEAARADTSGRERAAAALGV